MYLLYYLLLTLAHLLYGFIRAVQINWLKLKRLFDDFMYDSRLRAEAERIICKVYDFNKTPKHFALIIGYEEPSVADLSRILSWCLISGIPYVTFYDDHGRLKKHEKHMKEEFLKCNPELSDHIKWNPQLSSKTIKNGTNGIKYKTRIQCKSHEDSRGKIVVLAQDLAKAVKVGSITIDEITLELLNSKLNPEKVPDPDLAVICGDTFTTYGFLPWHTRITEFHLIPTHHNFSLTEFINVLKIYSTSEQRYGK